MTTTQATLKDFRAIGAEFGTNVARCVLQAMADGYRDPALHRDYIFGVLLPAKRDELKIIGASEREASVYIKSAIRKLRIVTEAIVASAPPPTDETVDDRLGHA